MKYSSGLIKSLKDGIADISGLLYVQSGESVKTEKKIYLCRINKYYIFLSLFILVPSVVAYYIHSDNIGVLFLLGIIPVSFSLYLRFSLLWYFLLNLIFGYIVNEKVYLYIMILFFLISITFIDTIKFFLKKEKMLIDVSLEELNTSYFFFSNTGFFYLLFKVLINSVGLILFSLFLLEVYVSNTHSSFYFCGTNLDTCIIQTIQRDKSLLFVLFEKYMLFKGLIIIIIIIKIGYFIDEIFYVLNYSRYLNTDTSFSIVLDNTCIYTCKYTIFQKKMFYMIEKEALILLGGLILFEIMQYKGLI